MLLPTLLKQDFRTSEAESLWSQWREGVVIQSPNGTGPFGFLDELGHCALMSWEEGANSHADYNDRGGSNNI